MARILSALVLALAIPGLSCAAGDLELEARELDALLIAPCCFSQQVSIHQSEAADAVRRDIRRRLKAGQTRDEILDAYVEQYGKRILVEPPAEGFDRLLYVLPPLGFVLTAALTIVLVRRFANRASVTRREPPISGPPGSDADARYRAALDEELHDLD